MDKHDSHRKALSDSVREVRQRFFPRDNSRAGISKEKGALPHRKHPQTGLDYLLFSAMKARHFWMSATFSATTSS